MVTMIKRRAVLGSIVVAGLLAAYVSAQRAPEFSIERLADNLVVIRDAEDGNTAVFVRSDGAFIVFRGLGVMHAGDTFPGLSPVPRDGGSAEAYPATMYRAAAEISGVRTVIPGHGSIKTWQDFVDNAAKLRRSR